MKIYKRTLLLTILLLVFFTAFSTRDVGGENSDLNTYRYEWEDDSIISGVEQITKIFYVQQNMEINNFLISLKVKPSPTLVKELSSISILVNNTKIDSVTIDKLEDDNIITVQVPKHLIAKGGNSISIKGFLKSTFENCEINDEINWLIIERTSFYSFNYSRADSVHVSDIFDSTYYSDGVKGQVNIVLPNSLVRDNYSQVASLSALLGFIHKDKETSLGLNTFKYSDLDRLDKESIIIGTPDQIKAFDKDLLTDREWQDAEQAGFIAIRKIGNKNHFIIISSGESQLQTLCNILQNKTSLAQIKGRNYILDENKIVNEKQFNTDIYLRELGYENFSQVGTGVKSFDYYFAIPARKTLTSNNKLTFVYNYSSIIGEEKGYVTVAVNGENIGSKELLTDRNQDKIEITIPEKYFAYVGFNISLKFNATPNLENCTFRRYDNIWVGVDVDNSKFKLGLEDREGFYLLNSQGLLQNSNGRLDGLIGVDSYKNIYMDSICQISAHLGKVSQGVNKLLIYEAEDKANNGQAIFALTKSPIVKTISEKLRIPVSKEGELIHKNLFVQNTPSLGAIAITPGDNNLIIIANDKDQLNSAIQSYPSVAGVQDTVIIRDKKVIDTFMDAKSRADKRPGFIQENYEIVLALAVLLVASIIIFIIYFKKIR